MNEISSLGKNRTGIAMSPVDSLELIEAARSASPSSSGDERLLAQVLTEYAGESEPLGSIPPPMSLKGAAESAVAMLKGDSHALFVDKLGERLAFERSGSRLYEALIAKYRAATPTPKSPTLEELVAIHRDELTHFEMLREVIESLGGDPTVVTPSADVVSVIAMGLPQLLHDPRSSFEQCVTAILVAELADNDSWNLLVQLAGELGHKDLAKRFQDALVTEERHLTMVRGWMRRAVLFAPPPG